MLLSTIKMSQSCKYVSTVMLSGQQKCDKVSNRYLIKSFYEFSKKTININKMEASCCLDKSPWHTSKNPKWFLFLWHLLHIFINIYSWRMQQWRHYIWVLLTSQSQFQNSLSISRAWATSSCWCLSCSSLSSSRSQSARSSMLSG